MKDDYYWFWINNITGIANIKLRYLFKVFDTPEDIYKASDKMFEGVMGIKPDDIYSIKEISLGGNQMIYSLVEDKSISMEKGAQKLGISVEKLRANMINAGYKCPDME